RHPGRGRHRRGAQGDPDRVGGATLPAPRLNTAAQEPATHRWVAGSCAVSWRVEYRAGVRCLRAVGDAVDDVDDREEDAESADADRPVREAAVPLRTQQDAGYDRPAPTEETDGRKLDHQNTVMGHPRLPS